MLALGIGVAFPLVSNIAASLAPRGRYAGATAMNSSLRQVGAALGVAVIVVVVGHPGPSEVHGAFERGWLFASVCFGLVAVGALALRRVDATPKTASFIEGVRDIVAHTPTPAAPRDSVDRRNPWPCRWCRAARARSVDRGLHQSRAAVCRAARGRDRRTGQAGHDRDGSRGRMAVSPGRQR